MKRTPEQQIAQFWERVDKSGGEDACWNWTRGCSGGASERSYGQYYMGERKVTTHRLAYQLVYGEIPSGMEVCHTCDNPSCCNPRHLFLGTHKDNMQDRERKGRGTAKGQRRGLQNPASTDIKPPSKKCGSHNGQSKLDEDDVRLIRSVYADGTMSQRKLAKEFHVHPSLIGFIVRRVYWQHIE